MKRVGKNMARALMVNWRAFMNPGDWEIRKAHRNTSGIRSKKGVTANAVKPMPS
jgi:hypothetical protein